MPDESYSQDHRLIAVDTPLGKDVLLLQELTGYEGISRLFSYELDLLAFENTSIAFDDVVGKKVIDHASSSRRHAALYQRVREPFYPGRNGRAIIHPLPRPSGALALVPDSPGRLPHFPEPGSA